MIGYLSLSYTAVNEISASFWTVSQKIKLKAKNKLQIPLQRHKNKKKIDNK